MTRATTISVDVAAGAVLDERVAALSHLTSLTCAYAADRGDAELRALLDAAL